MLIGVRWRQREKTCPYALEHRIKALWYAVAPFSISEIVGPVWTIRAVALNRRNFLSPDRQQRKIRSEEKNPKVFIIFNGSRRKLCTTKRATTSRVELTFLHPVTVDFPCATLCFTDNRKNYFRVLSLRYNTWIIGFFASLLSLFSLLSLSSTFLPSLRFYFPSFLFAWLLGNYNIV